jgi:hypothetical protein
MSDGNAKGWSSLCQGVSAILIVWILVLPWIGSRQWVRSRIEYLDRHGIDPAALYYTDLEAMERIESDVAAISQQHPDAFWSMRTNIESARGVVP